ncbi:MAG TPA: phage protein Gp27 family protein [Kaistia sp.]|nr:phage protein Gp27 family protein [Kaistia sp.]
MASGRGRLSFWDTLPDWAEPVRIWAYDQLKESKLTQLEILDEVNNRLRAAAWAEGITADVPQASRSSLNRAAMRLAKLGRRLQETREIAAVLAPKLDQAGDNSLTLLVSETIKTLISEMLSNAGELPADGETAEMLMFTSRALKHAEEAKKISTDTRKQMQDELTKKAGQAVEAVMKAQGGSPEDIEALKKAIGVQIRNRD